MRNGDSDSVSLFDRRSFLVRVAGGAGGHIVTQSAPALASLPNRDPGAPLGREFEVATVLSAFKRHRVKNVAWVPQTCTTAPPITTTRPSLRSPI